MDRPPQDGKWSGKQAVRECYAVAEDAVAFACVLICPITILGLIGDNPPLTMLQTSTVTSPYAPVFSDRRRRHSPVG